MRTSGITSPLLEWFVAFAGTAALIGFLSVYALGLARPPIRSDGFSYYVYLPAWTIQHDPSLQATADECCSGSYPQWTAIFRWPTTGRWVNPHPIGEALLVAPFFLAADGLTRWSNLYRDGFSFYYQYAAGLAGVAYFAAGLFFLRRLLRRHFSIGVTVASLVSIVWGTNLFHYATYDSMFAHVFSFFLLAAFLDVGLRWLETPAPGRAVAMGALAALIILVRHTNGIVLIVPVACALASENLRLRPGQIAAAAGVLVALLLPQVLLYRYGTGEWLFSPYGPNGHFDFRSPHVMQVLFGTQKGLFFWSPILLFAIAGMPLLPRHFRGALLPTLVVFTVTLMLIASWSDWQMGGSFGHRGFTDLIPLLALPLAALFDWSTRKGLAIPVGIAAGLAVALSIAQMIQYWLRIIPFSDTTWTVYKSIFLKFTR